MKKFYLIAAGVLIIAAACSSSRKASTAYGPQTGADGWTTLFDGHTLIGWHPYQNKNPHSWEAQNGVLHCAGSETDKSDRQVDLVTNDSFQNFDLELDWKIAPKGNSGIMYLVKEDQ